MTIRSLKFFQMIASKLFTTFVVVGLTSIAFGQVWGEDPNYPNMGGFDMNGNPIGGNPQMGGFDMYGNLIWGNPQMSGFSDMNGFDMNGNPIGGYPQMGGFPNSNMGGFDMYGNPIGGYPQIGDFPDMNGFDMTSFPMTGFGLDAYPLMGGFDTDYYPSMGAFANMGGFGMNGYPQMSGFQSADPMQQMNMLMSDFDRQTAWLNQMTQNSMQQIDQELVRLQQEQNKRVEEMKQFFINYYRQKTGDTTSSDEVALMKGDQLWCQDNPVQCQQNIEASKQAMAQSQAQHKQNMQLQQDLFDMNQESYKKQQAANDRSFQNFMNNVINTP